MDKRRTERNDQFIILKLRQFTIEIPGEAENRRKISQICDPPQQKPLL